jgi:hypothetical protein
LGSFSRVVISLLTSGMVRGQAKATAQVNSTVKDQSGAALPGAEVTLTQTKTGLARNAVTNETDRTREGNSGTDA